MLNTLILDTFCFSNQKIKNYSFKVKIEYDIHKHIYLDSIIWNSAWIHLWGTRAMRKAKKNEKKIKFLYFESSRLYILNGWTDFKNLNVKMSAWTSCLKWYQLDFCEINTKGVIPVFIKGRYIGPSSLVKILMGRYVGL